jgi:hypothetical protein
MKDPDAIGAWEVQNGEVGCPIEMVSDVDLIPIICGRKLHAALDGADKQAVCLMHSKDPNKQSGPLYDAFWQEFERTLNSAGEGEAHFEYFIFPQIDLRYRKYQAICKFDGATFTQDSDFSLATFIKYVSFREAFFTQGANFGKTIFTQDANFDSVTFAQEAHFWNSTFTQDANFRFATFTQDAEFAVAIFMGHAHFDSAAFMQDANFGGSTLTLEADFNHAYFTQSANFADVTFTQNADFSFATFIQDANFERATFTLKVDFCYATFTQMACFSGTTLSGAADWRRGRFLDQAEFRQTKFESKVEGEPGALFALAKFSKPHEIVFDNVDLSHVLFQYCDVSQVLFTSFVRWGKRKGNRGLTVFEEKILLDPKLSTELKDFVHIDHFAVEQIYQQLKKNYDSRLDYRTANDFHYGEMEMRRLAGPTDGRLLWLRRWWHRNLSFVAWYKYASDYGNSYGKPLAWLFVVLLTAALLFPIPGVGLKQPISGNAASSVSVTYSIVWDKNDSWTNNFWTEAKLIGKSGITAIDTATFQRTPEYTPVYPRGRVVAIFETLLTSSLFALFLLAIRRQFRR